MSINQDIRKAGATSVILQIWIEDSGTPGTGLTGLTDATSGLVAYFCRDTDTGETAITLASGTLGTWSPGGFKEIDATNMPGWYQLGIPNAAIAAGAQSVAIQLQGAASMLPCLVFVRLDAVSPVKNVALAAFPFVMFDTTGTPAPGLTVTATRSIDGGAFAACANAVSAIANGGYKIDLAASDLNGSTILLRFTATGAVDTIITVLTQ